MSSSNKNSDQPAPVRLGLIGLGFAGTVLHLPSLSRNSRARIVAVSDLSESKLSQFSADFPDLHVRKELDYRSIIHDPTIDAVLIASPTPSHAAIAVDALKANKHVFCEKPISNTIADAQKMIDEAERHPDLILMIGQVLRFWPEYVQIKKQIEYGKIGRPIIARTYRANPMPASQFYEKDELSGGVIVDLGLHDIDFLSWALGPVKSVFAQGGNLSGRGDVIDYAQIHFNFVSGAIAYLEANWALPENFPFSTAIEITGTGGMIAADNCDSRASYQLTLKGQKRFTAAIAQLNGYHYEQEAFLKAVQNKRETPMNAAAALYSLRLAMAAKESIKTGKLIVMDEATKTASASASLNEVAK
ncbi:MAG: Gfo/Idh/MocA family oxidoreductase [Cyanobacteria bacterium SZAS LIN-5]|nr:Gfo/Idh/MocA family oxidoreductase [Cyanobacteria bacterium SZAS LIN-5]